MGANGETENSQPYRRMSGVGDTRSQSRYECLRLSSLIAAGTVVLFFSGVIALDFASLAAERTYPVGGHNHTQTGRAGGETALAVFNFTSSLISNFPLSVFSIVDSLYVSMKFFKVLSKVWESCLRSRSQRTFTAKENLILISLPVAAVMTAYSFWASLRIANDTIEKTQVSFMKGQWSSLFLVSMLLFSITTQATATQGIVQSALSRLLDCYQYGGANSGRHLSEAERYIDNHPRKYWVGQVALLYATNLFFPFWLAKSDLARNKFEQVVSALMKQFFYLRCAWRFQATFINFHSIVGQYRICHSVLRKALVFSIGAVTFWASGSSMYNEYKDSADDFGPVGRQLVDDFPFLFPGMGQKNKLNVLVMANILKVIAGCVANGLGMMLCVTHFASITAKISSLSHGQCMPRHSHESDLEHNQKKALSPRLARTDTPQPSETSAIGRKHSGDTLFKSLLRESRNEHEEARKVTSTGFV